MSEDTGSGTDPYDANKSAGELGWPAILTFCAADLGGLIIAVILFKTFGVAAFIGDEARTISGEILEPLVLMILIAASARPRGVRQLAWYAMLILMLTLCANIASWFAGLAQIYIGPERLYFVSHAAFLFLIAPACVVVVLAFKRLAMLPDLGGKPGMLHWIGITIPGFLAAALVLDLLDAGGLVVAGPYAAEPDSMLLLFPPLFGAFLATKGASPRRPGHWILLGSVIGVAAVGGVILFTLVKWYLGDDNLLAHPMAFILTTMIQFATVSIARAATGPNGSWPDGEKWKWFTA